MYSFELVKNITAEQLNKLSDAGLIKLYISADTYDAEGKDVHVQLNMIVNELEKRGIKI